MGENGKDERVKLENYSTLELLTKLDHEQDDEKWNIYWAELVQREPFKGMDDCLQDAFIAIDELKETVDVLQKVVKQHEHLHGSVVVKI